MDNVTALLLLCALACAPIALILDAFGWRRAESAVPIVFGASAVFLLGAMLAAAIEVLYG